MFAATVAAGSAAIAAARGNGHVTVPSRRVVLLAQGAYYVITGVLPFASRRVFEAATGPKREWWLVQTVGGLVTVVGSAILVAAGRERYGPELVGIAAGSATVLAAIDIVYVAKRRISPRYLVDAAAELTLLAGLAASDPRTRATPQRGADPVRR